MARLFHEESTLTILKRGEVDKTLPGVMNTKISKVTKTETFRGDVQIIILVITVWKDIVFGRSWQMYVISSSEAHSTRRLWHTRNIRKITALMGKTPVAAIVEETCFGLYHFGARGWVRDIRYNRTRWPSPMKLTMSSWWRENRLKWNNPFGRGSGCCTSRSLSSLQACGKSLRHFFIIMSSFNFT